MNEDRLKELLFESFRQGNSYSMMPEDDYSIVKKDFENWYSELDIKQEISSINSNND